MKQQINRLPAPTFRWLKMNGAAADLPEDLQVREITAAAGSTEQFLLVSTKDRPLSSQKYILHLEKGAEVHLALVVADAEAADLIPSVEADCGEGAVLHVYWLLQGGRSVYPSCRADLTGAGSRLELDGAYLVHPHEALDMSVEANHIGRRTESRISLKGVLYDGARKIFRGTIDFRRGCKGACGDEREEVLLMDDEAVNQTVPLILCAEEDVAGNHGASIGRLDEEMQFYLQSRGLDPEEIERILLRGRIQAVIGKMPQELQAQAAAAAGISAEEED